MEKVKEYEWIRLNEQQNENKRLAKMDEMEAEELGVGLDDEEVGNRGFSVRRSTLYLTSSGFHTLRRARSSWMCICLRRK